MPKASGRTGSIAIVATSAAGAGLASEFAFSAQSSQARPPMRSSRAVQRVASAASRAAPWGNAGRLPSRACLAGVATTAAATGSVRRRAVASEVQAPEVDKVKSLLDEHDIVMFSKTTCPFCSRAKDALAAEAPGDFFVMELDELPAEEGAAMQDALLSMTGARTVPRIFAKGRCLGGCDDVVALQQQGELAKALKGEPSFALQKSEDEWKQALDPSSYYILRQQGTEPPGSHEYNNFLPSAGHFACGACGLPLYSATSKFRSNCGWPVFKECYYSEAAGGCHVGTNSEFGGLEIVCNRCDSHLGHVFFDAFKPDNPNGERH